MPAQRPHSLRQDRGYRRSATRKPADGVRRAPSFATPPPAAISIGACSAPSSNTSAARSTRACTSPAPASPMRRGFAATSPARSRSSASRLCGIRGAISSPVQLARRRRPEGAAPRGPRSRMELARDEPVRHQRVRRLVRDGRRRAAARHELRHRLCRDGGRLRRVPATAVAGRGGATSPIARARSPAQGALLVSGQRNGRPLADRAAPGARVRPQGPRRRQTDAGDRSRTCS